MLNLPTDLLLIRAQTLLQIRATGKVGNRQLTLLGYDWIDGELCAIDYELDQRKPEGEFRDLIEDTSNLVWSLRNYIVVGFERAV